MTPLRQPEATEFVVSKISELPTRTRPGLDGYDAIGIVAVECPNDGTPITVLSRPPAPAPNDLFSYESMIRRTVHQYDFLNAESLTDTSSQSGSEEVCVPLPEVRITADLGIACKR